LDAQIENDVWRNVVLTIAAGLISFPFLWAILVKKISVKGDDGAIQQYYLNYSLTSISLHAIRYLLGIFLIGFFVDQITTTRYALMVAVPTIIVLLRLFSDRVQKIYQRIENQFMSNLHEREQLELIKNKAILEIQHKNEESKKHFQEWNAYVTELEASDTVFFAGMTLYELNWKELYGINIVYIRRNNRTIHLPDGKQRILPFDKVGVLGTDEQISQLKVLFDQKILGERGEEDIDTSDIKLIKVRVTETNPYSGQTIKAAGIRKDLRCQVVGIEVQGDESLIPVPQN
jgi:CPA2 family monovalent cation:H+ antiporter-2